MSTQNKDDFDRLFEELGLRRGSVRPRAFIRSGTGEISLAELGKHDRPSDPETASRVGLTHSEIVDCVLKTAQSAFPDPDCRIKSIRAAQRYPVPSDRSVTPSPDYHYDTMAFLIEVPSKRQKIGKHEITLSIGGLRVYPGSSHRRSAIPRDGLFQLLIGYHVYVCTNLCYSTEGVQLEVQANTVEELQTKVRSLIDSFDCEKPLREMHNWAGTHLTSSRLDELFTQLQNRAVDRPPVERSTRRKRVDALNARRMGLPFRRDQVARARHGLRNDRHFHRARNGSISLWNLYNLFTESVKDAPFERFLTDHEQVYRFVQGLYLQSQWERLSGEQGIQSVRQARLSHKPVVKGVES